STAREPRRAPSVSPPRTPASPSSSSPASAPSTPSWSGRSQAQPSRTWARWPRRPPPGSESGLVLVELVDGDDLRCAGRAQDQSALRALAEGGLLLGVRERRAAVLAPVGELLDGPLFQLHGASVFSSSR